MISGHRDLTSNDVLVIQKTMQEFVAYDDFDYFMFGGARGADTTALVFAAEARGPRKHPELIVVVPDVVSVQPTNARTWFGAADRIIELRHPITRADNFWALHHRNEFMIDWIAPDGRLLAFWSKRPSGTANAVYYARRQGVEVTVREIQGRVE